MRYLGPQDEIQGLPPVAYKPVSRTKYRMVLQDAKDERPLQRFFEENPALLVRGLTRPHRSWVFPRANLPKPEGGSWIPDFMICDWGSIGPRWTIVELEGPRQKAVLRSGKISAICRHAQQQIDDDRRHLAAHASQLRDGGWPMFGGKVSAWILIGRSSEARVALGIERLAQLRDYDIEIATYDRLFKEYKDIVQGELSSDRALKNLVKRVAGRVPDRPNKRSKPPRTP